ncbi:hypothetical protein LINGRAHAP2_LOCUS19171 [Linum grandiflorum]
MFRTLARLRRDTRKSPRVADETTSRGSTMVMITRVGGIGDHQCQQQQQLPPIAHTTMNKFTTIVSLVLLPFSCLSQPRVNMADRMWASTEVLPRSTEVNNHAMVNESMRYAIPICSM